MISKTTSIPYLDPNAVPLLLLLLQCIELRDTHFLQTLYPFRLVICKGHYSGVTKSLLLFSSCSKWSDDMHLFLLLFLFASSISLCDEVDPSNAIVTVAVNVSISLFSPWT